MNEQQRKDIEWQVAVVETANKVLWQAEAAADRERNKLSNMLYEATDTSSAAKPEGT